MQWSASALPPKKWANNHTPCLVATTPLKSWVAQADSNSSKTLKTGLERGHWKDKACFMELSLCSNLGKTHPIQQSLIQEVPSFQSPLMFSTKSEKNGKLPYQTSIALQIKHFVMLQILAKMLRKRLSQLVSK
jgi:hypothetical protein